MTNTTGKRPKLVLYTTKKVPPTPGTSVEDFKVYSSYRGSGSSGFYGTLKIVRATDGKLLFPFDGAEVIGPFSTKADALAAAQQRADEIVRADLLSPEL